MPSAETMLPVRMSRVAVVAPRERLRETLVELADLGTVELAGRLPPAESEEVEALRRLDRSAPSSAPAHPLLSRRRPDLAALERAGARDLLAGEAAVARQAGAAAPRGSFAALVGWTPTPGLPATRQRLERHGAAVVELPRPSSATPPTLFAPAPLRRPFRPLVNAYGVAPYADLDPALFAGLSFVLMFGMMFGDVGHGLLLVGLGLGLRRVRRGRLLAFRRFWLLPLAAGLSAAAFGLLYGEAFGPTGLVPRLWLDPAEEPERLLAAAVALGLVLLTASHVLGTVNRWRESGPAAALLSQTGVAGLGVLLGGALAAAGWYAGLGLLAGLGAVVAGLGVLLLFTGFLAVAGSGAAAVTQATVELFDAIVRIVSNALSFARLAAFGLMHSVLGAVVFAAAGALWGGVAGSLAAVLVFVAGNAAAFSIGLLVAGVQTVRLEFYELFSRIFAGEGHPFAPLHIPVVPDKEGP